MPRAKLSQAGDAIPNPIFADPTGRRRVALLALSAVSALLLAFLAYDFIARVHYLHLEQPRMEISVEEPAPASSTPPPVSIVMNDGPDGACGEEGRNEAESEPIVAAYLKAGDITAYSALIARCRQLDLVLAEAVNLVSPDGSVALLSDKARPLSELVEDGAFQVLPVLGVGPGLSGPELTAFLNSSDDVARLRSRINLLRDGAFANGLCLDLSRHGNLPSTTVDSALRSLKAGADPICLIAPADADYWKDASLVAGLDIAVVQGFRASANPGEPPAPESWFTTSIDEVLADIPPEKLIVALETSGHSWQSGRPGERQLSYAETLHELVENRGTFSFRPETGTAKVRYVDAERKLNETWLFDAVSFNNQLAHLGAERSIAIWSLGYEDPGVWELLDQSHGSRVLRDGIDLGHVLRIEGAGALVVDVVPARQGLRILDREEMTGRIIGQRYDVFPTPSRLRRTERELSAGLAVTFQGIPSRDTAAQLLGLLEHHGIEATFFVDVPALLPAGDVASALVEAGHHIGLHTGDARSASAASTLAGTFSRNSAQLLLAHRTGARTRLIEFDRRSEGLLWRAEFDSYTKQVTEGYLPVLPGPVSRFGDVEAGTFVEHVSAQASEGLGVLSFDLTPTTNVGRVLDELPAILSRLQAEGHRFTSLRKEANLDPAEMMPPAGARPLLRDTVVFTAAGFAITGLDTTFLILLAIAGFRSAVYLALALSRRPQKNFDPGYRPRVTVIVPAHNEEKVIESCICSLLASDYPPVAIIVVDDGSTDRTADIVSRKFGGEANIHLIRQPNRGKWAAANAALAVIDTPVMVIADADSVFLPDTIGWLVQQFKDENVGAVAGVVEIGNRENLLSSFQNLEYLVSQNVMRRAQEMFNGIIVVPGAVGAWRTQAVREASLFSGDTVTEDADLTIAVHRAGYLVRFQEQARSVTEAPTSVRAFMRQRFRWTFGMLQASWKHRHAISELRPVGLISIVDAIWFGVVSSLVAPLVDVLLLLLVAMGLHVLLTEGAASLSHVPFALLFGYFALMGLDMLNTIAAMRWERRFDARILMLVPFLRFGYRQLLYISAIRALVRAATGRPAGWNKLHRSGAHLSVWTPASNELPGRAAQGRTKSRAEATHGPRELAVQ